MTEEKFSWREHLNSYSKMLERQRVRDTHYLPCGFLITYAYPVGREWRVGETYYSLGIDTFDAHRMPAYRAEMYRRFRRHYPGCRVLSMVFKKNYLG